MRLLQKLDDLVLDHHVCCQPDLLSVLVTVVLQSKNLVYHAIKNSVAVLQYNNP